MSYYSLNILDAPQIVRADMLSDVETIILRMNRLENYLGLSRSAMTTAGPMDDMTTLFAIVGETSLSAMRDRVDYLRAHYGAPQFSWRHTPAQADFESPTTNDICGIDARQLLELSQAIGRSYSGTAAKPHRICYGNPSFSETRQAIRRLYGGGMISDSYESSTPMGFATRSNIQTGYGFTVTAISNVYRLDEPYYSLLEGMFPEEVRRLTTLTSSYTYAVRVCAGGTGAGELDWVEQEGNGLWGVYDTSASTNKAVSMSLEITHDPVSGNRYDMRDWEGTHEEFAPPRETETRAISYSLRSSDVMPSSMDDLRSAPVGLTGYYKWMMPDDDIESIAENASLAGTFTAWAADYGAWPWYQKLSEAKWATANVEDNTETSGWLFWNEPYMPAGWYETLRA